MRKSDADKKLFARSPNFHRAPRFAMRRLLTTKAASWDAAFKKMEAQDMEILRFL
jgi:hypothetical protein